MDNVLIILTQLLKMVLYMAVGFCLCRGGIIAAKESRGLTQLLLYVVLPCVILRSYLSISRDQMHAVFLSLAVGAAALLISMLIARLCFRNYPMDHFGAAFSNAGFLGIPLIDGILGESAVFYIAGMVALMNVLQWTYGQRVLSGKKNAEGIKGLLKNPLLIAFAAGILLYLSGLKVPGPLEDCMGALASCNAPISMIILGISIGNSKLREIFTIPRAYGVSLVRLVVIPVVTMLCLWPIPDGYRTMKMAIVIAASAPIGSNVVIYAQKNGLNDDYGTKIVCLSTLLSLFTMPVMLLTAETLF